MLPLRKVYSQVSVPEDEIGVPVRGRAICRILRRVNHLRYCLPNPTPRLRRTITYSFYPSHRR